MVLGAVGAWSYLVAVTSLHITPCLDHGIRVCPDRARADFSIPALCVEEEP